MKKLIAIFIFFMTTVASAEDQWLCTDDQAFKNGSAYGICGVGTAAAEGDARQKALINSMQEFQIICSSSQDCKGHKFNVIPKRSTCYEGKSSTGYSYFTCHRLLVYEVL